MANTKNNVSVGKPKITGAVWRAPANTTAPTDATTALGNTFICMGYVSADGFKNTNSKEHTEIKAWGGDVVAVPLTSHSDKFTGTFIEALNTEVLKAAHGDSNVTGDTTNGITVNVNSADDSDHVYVVDMEMQNGLKKRIVIPMGRITEVGEVTYKDDEVIGYPLTISALPDNDGNTHYEYIS